MNSLVFFSNNIYKYDLHGLDTISEEVHVTRSNSVCLLSEKGSTLKELFSFLFTKGLVFKHNTSSINVARNFMKMKPANRISEISAEAQHFLQGCMRAHCRLRSARPYTHSKQNHSPFVK